MFSRRVYGAENETNVLDNLKSSRYVVAMSDYCVMITSMYVSCVAGCELAERYQHA